MVHNGIEYALMAAYAEGLNIISGAGGGRSPARSRRRDGTAPGAALLPLRPHRPRRSRRGVAAWQRHRVLAARPHRRSAARRSQTWTSSPGGCADSGEGRWTSIAAIDEGVPAPLLTAALYSRFASRGGEILADKVQSAQRFEFGGHVEKKAAQ